MRPGTTAWLCPVCVDVLDPGFRDCPSCGTSADWLDLLRAFDFTIRRYELWKLEGILTPEEYRALLAYCRPGREALVRSASRSEPVPADTGLPDPRQCWSCQQPVKPLAPVCTNCNSELQSNPVRILRYQAYLCREVRRHAEAGRLSLAQWEASMTDTPARQIELLERLRKGQS